MERSLDQALAVQCLEFTVYLLVQVNCLQVILVKIIVLFEHERGSPAWLKYETESFRRECRTYAAARGCERGGNHVLHLTVSVLYKRRVWSVQTVLTYPLAHALRANVSLASEAWMNCK